MKKNLLIVAAITLSVITMASCKKNSDDTPSLSGNWNADKLINWETDHSTSITTKDTTNFQSGSYVNFASDGKLYSKFIVMGLPQYDTSYYTISGNYVYSQDVAGGPNTDTMQVQTLTANNAVLHGTSQSSSFSDENWIYLSR